MKRYLLCPVFCFVALTGVTCLAQSSATTLPSDPSLASVQAPSANQPDEFQTTQIQEADISSENAGGAQLNSAKPSAARPSSQSSNDRLEASAIPPSAASRPMLQPRTIPTESVLPAATVLRLKLVRSLSTVTDHAGEKFFATLTSPVVVDGRTIIPSGTSVACRVDSTHAGRRLGGKAYIAFRALSAHLPSGEILNFSASVIDTANPRKLDVDQEGRVRGVTFSPMDKVETASLAGAGLITGAIVAGPQGLFIGAASGAALAAGHILTKHRDLTVPAGTELILELDAPATIAHP